VLTVDHKDVFGLMVTHPLFFQNTHQLLTQQKKTNDGCFVEKEKEKLIDGVLCRVGDMWSRHHHQ